MPYFFQQGKEAQMITYKVTWHNARTGNTNSVIAQAQSLESALAEETRMVQVMQKRNPEITLVSVEEQK